MSGKKFLQALFLTIFAVLVPTSFVSAQYTGTNYKIEEAQVGSAGSDNDLSTSTYKGRAGIGDTGVGITSSSSYQGIGGFTTSDTPELEVIVNTPSVDLGIASATSAIRNTATPATFTVRAYLASSYKVYTRGGLPTSESGATVPGMASTATPTVGVAQFGINLVANTSPSYGSNPQQVPFDAVNPFSFGAASAGYNTPDQFKYVDGDEVANSTKSSGVTLYTISYVVNIAPTTPAGVYTLAHQMIVVATY